MAAPSGSRAVFIAKTAEQREKFPRRNVDTAAHLDGFDQYRADLLASKQAADVGLR